nr:MAG TPA: hypothetical protein [Caudoviricetes sp.]
MCSAIVSKIAVVAATRASSHAVRRPAVSFPPPRRTIARIGAVATKMTRQTR